MTDSTEIDAPWDGMKFKGPAIPEGAMAMDALILVRVQSVASGRSQVVNYRSVGIDDVTESGILHIAILKDRLMWEGAFDVVQEGEDDEFGEL